MSIPGILQINGYNLIGNLAQNTAAAPNGLDASIANNLGVQNAAAPIPVPDFTVSLQQAADNFNILQNNPFVAQPVLNPGSSPTLEAISLAQVNLQTAEGNAVLQADENPTQALLGLTNPEPPLEALLSTPFNVQAVQLANATAPNGLVASLNNPASIANNLGVQNAAALLLIPTPTPTPVPTPAPTPAFTVTPVSPTLETLSPAQINLQAVESIGVLQANENLAQALFGLTNPGTPVEELLSTPPDVQAVQRVNATEHIPGRSQSFLTAYFKVMNMPISSSAVDRTA